jgi:GNAT superfamily N-acetyltransferase
MRSTTCFCGEALTADNLDALVPVARAHFDARHPDLGLEDHHIRDYLEAEERITGSTERLDEIGEVEIHEVTADRLDDLLRFFDHDAFAGNPAWAACYCMCHHVRGAGDWESRTAAENRADLVERVEAGTTSGYLAYVDGRPAAWCNASPRAAYPEYASRDDLDDDAVGSVVCFVIAPPYRRHGLARRLLDAASQGFAARGMTAVEAYPRREAPTDDPAAPDNDAAAYHGPLGLYLDAGFAPVADREQAVVVRKHLDA